VLRLTLVDSWQDLGGLWSADAPEWVRTLGVIATTALVKDAPCGRLRRGDGGTRGAPRPVPWAAPQGVVGIVGVGTVSVPRHHVCAAAPCAAAACAAGAGVPSCACGGCRAAARTRPRFPSRSFPQRSPPAPADAQAGPPRNHLARSWSRAGPGAGSLGHSAADRARSRGRRADPWAFGPVPERA
jgi:hypothetical protein